MQLFLEGGILYTTYCTSEDGPFVIFFRAYGLGRGFRGPVLEGSPAMIPRIGCLVDISSALDSAQNN